MIEKPGNLNNKTIETKNAVNQALSRIGDVLIEKGLTLPIEDMLAIQSGVDRPTDEASEAIKRLIEMLGPDQVRCNSDIVVLLTGFRESAERSLKEHAEIHNSESKDIDRYNNLWLRLPDPSGTSDSYRTLEKLGKLDTPFAAKNNQNASELARRITYRQFYAILNDVLETLSKHGIIDIEKIKKNVKIKIDGGGNRDSVKAMEELVSAMKPIYDEMISRGFSHQDLWT